MPNVLFFVHTCSFRIAVAKEKFEVNFKNDELKTTAYAIVQQDFIYSFEIERIS